MSPVETLLDEHQHVRALACRRMALEDGRWKDTGETLEFPARAVMLAAGTNPNIIYERSIRGRSPWTRGPGFAAHRAVEQPDGRFRVEQVQKGGLGFFTSYEKDGRLVSFFGDAHPVFAGNVVKAMASSYVGYREVARLFEREVAKQELAEQAERENAWVRVAEVLEDGLKATVVDAIRLADRIVEVIVRAPLAAQRFQPGQFYRRRTRGPGEVVERSASPWSPGAHRRWVDRRGLVSTIVLEMGGSSDLCVLLEPGEPVVLMGPTGSPTETPAGETVLLAGGGLGRCSSRSAACARRRPACSTSPASAWPTATRWRRSRPRRTWWCGPRTKRRASLPTGRRI
jgi:hypothetical protein